MKKPMIGILGNLEVISQPAGLGIYRCFSNQEYIEAVKAGGGIPFIIPITNELDEEALTELIQRIDGLVVQGGLDIASDLYGEEPCQQQGTFIRHLDEAYLAAIKLADELGKPVLGICKGMQAINVAYGGTLYQDLPSQKTEVIQHKQKIARSEGVHHIGVKEESFLGKCVGIGKVLVNSLHHQAVKDLAVGFKVTAEAPDGVVEAIEKEAGTPVIGVQWHPEEMATAGNELQKNIFREFINLCVEK